MSDTVITSEAYSPALGWTKTQKVVRLSSKRGRPRKTPEIVDRGTAELQARRGVDQRHSYPLGVLFMAGDITEDQHQAGCWYAWLYGFTCGRVTTAAVDWNHQPGGNREGWPDGLTGRFEEYFKRVAGDLATDRRAKDAVDNLVVYGRAPRWMQPRRPTPGCLREAEAFHRGLAVVTRLFGLFGSSRRAA